MQMIKESKKELRYKIDRIIIKHTKSLQTLPFSNHNEQNIHYLQTIEILFKKQGVSLFRNALLV